MIRLLLFGKTVSVYGGQNWSLLEDISVSIQIEDNNLCDHWLFFSVKCISDTRIKHIIIIDS